MSTTDLGATRAPANKGRRYPAEPLSPDEAHRLLDAVPGNGPLAVRNRAMIATLWKTGVRVSELLGLYPRDLVDGAVRVRHGKGNRDRLAAIDGEALAYLRAWLEVRRRLDLNGRHPLFCTIADGGSSRGVRRRGEPLDPSYLRRLLPKLARRAGIEKRVHPHGLRHTHASELAMRGFPVPLISAQLGHGSTATTDVYIGKLTARDRLEAMRAFGWDFGEPI